VSLSPSDQFKKRNKVILLLVCFYKQKYFAYL
jgi:hypothetical protein